ncbi:MAG: hypothetical protein WDW36_006080 [Sanguina aurantia]
MLPLHRTSARLIPNEDLTVLYDGSFKDLGHDGFSPQPQPEHDPYSSADFSDLADDQHSSDHNGASAKETAVAVSLINKACYEVLRVDCSGRVLSINARRRDLLREHRLQPRDLRRIDPTVDNAAKASPSISIKENTLLLCLGGIRAIVTAEKALVFEPTSPATLKLLTLTLPRLRIPSTNIDGFPATSSKRLLSNSGGGGSGSREKSVHGVSHAEYMATYYSQLDGSGDTQQPRSLPFELEILEGALAVAVGRIEAEMKSVTKRVNNLWTKLPGEINPANLEELRRVKQALVELEPKADTLRGMLEELMNDEEEVLDLNLSSRPRREERKRKREVDRQKRKLIRAKEVKEEIEERRSEESMRENTIRGSQSSSSWPGSRPSGGWDPAASERSEPNGYSYGVGSGYGGGALSVDSVKEQRRDRIKELRTKYDQGRLKDLRSKLDQSNAAGGQLDSGRGGESWDRDRRRENMDGDDWERLEESEEDIQEAEDHLETLVEMNEEETEREEVEDLLEHYLQRALAIHSDSERLLAGARDLEESIGVSLSARRYEVNRLELMLSMGSFAAAVGAMFAGIFGMNMRHSLEHSAYSFWGISAIIVLGCAYVFAAIMAYTQRKKIL